jgi:hypothetical protein
MLISVFLAAALGAPSVASPANPLALADEGQLQCYRPDVQNKTCQAIATYRRTGPESYDNIALIPLSPNATLETHAPVVVKDGAVCGFVKGQDVLEGRLRVDGADVELAKAKLILERVAQAMAPMADKEICTKYPASGTNLTAKISIGGIYRPDQDVSVIWITPAAGYTVTP